MNLCLCPNCAATYRKFRANEALKVKIRKAFLEKNDADIEIRDYVTIALDDDHELWFTQTHFAEIRELLRLSEEVKNKKIDKVEQVSTDDKNEKPGMAVYSEYIGKTIRRKDGFVGKVIDVATNGKDTSLCVHVTGGKDKGKDTKISLSFILGNRDVYSFSDK